MRAAGLSAILNLSGIEGLTIGIDVREESLP
jgi:hypothetical protein